MLVSLDICWIYVSLDLTKAQQHNIFSQTLHIAGNLHIPHGPLLSRYPWLDYVLLRTSRDSQFYEACSAADAAIIQAVERNGAWGSATPGKPPLLWVGITRYVPKKKHLGMVETPWYG